MSHSDCDDLVVLYPPDISHAPYLFPEPLTHANPLQPTRDYDVPTYANMEFDNFRNVDSAFITPPPFSVENYLSRLKAIWTLCTFP